MQEESSIKNKLFRWSNSKLRKLNKKEAEIPKTEDLASMDSLFS